MTKPPYEPTASKKLFHVTTHKPKLLLYIKALLGNILATDWNGMLDKLICTQIQPAFLPQ